MSQTNENKAARETSPSGAALNETMTPYGGVSGLDADKEDRGWVEFRDQCRRQMDRTMEQRLQYGFCRIYKPVLDDAPWRSFASTAEYRAWCAENLPDYLGFKPAKK